MQRRYRCKCFYGAGEGVGGRFSQLAVLIARNRQKLLDFSAGMLCLYLVKMRCHRTNEFISCENFTFYEYKMISPQEVIASAQEWGVRDLTKLDNNSIRRVSSVR
jgi:hypothetical protein